jgi:CheY-like chemotaxis protein
MALRDMALEGTPFRVALIDANLEDTDGLEFVRAVAESEDLRTTRVLLLAPITQRNLGGTTLEAGAAGIVAKPIRRQPLHEALRSALGLGPETPGRTAGAQARPRHGRPRRQARVLLAEDNPINQKVATRMLDRLGHIVDVVDNGLAAIEAASRARYDVILMDCQMPRMDGYSATAEIRRIEGASRHTPIIAMTANAMQGDRERCLAAGMDDYVPKPIRSEQLYGALGVWTGWENPVDEGRGGGQPFEEPGPGPGPGGDDDGIEESILDDILQLSEETGPTLVRELIEIFFDQAPARLEELRRGVLEGDASRVTRAAHSMKGGGANIGLSRLAARCTELERLARAGALSGADAIVGEIEQELGRVRAALESRLGSLLSHR